LIRVKERGTASRHLILCGGGMLTRLQETEEVYR
jgi:hypothetical protein